MSGGPRAAWRVAGLAAWLAYAVLVVAGAPAVPFHPDEATQLYMSRDFDLLLRGQVADLAWDAAGQPVAVRRYRLLDAPAARFLAGLGRSLAGYAGQPLPSDWDWSADWEANARAGALPAPGLLLAARLPAALLTAAAPLLVWAIGRHMAGWPAGVTAAALYAGNGLVLLHGRRAMSEGALLFCLLLALWLAVRAPRRPLALGAAAAAAAAAKLSGGLAVPGTALALLWPPAAPPNGRALAWRDLMIGGLALIVAGWLLNPALWLRPLSGVRAMAEARAAFVAEQMEVTQALAPHTVPNTPGARLLAMVYHAHLAPLSFWDVGNYAAQTQAAEQRYLASPLLSGWPRPRHLALGAAGLALWLAGAGAAALRLLSPRADPSDAERRTLTILLAFTLSTVAVLLAFNLPMQRYYVPLVPFTCLWSAHALAQVALLARRARSAPQLAPLAGRAPKP